MRRREFIGALGAAAAWPLSPLRAQTRAIRIGWLTTASSKDVSPFFDAFRAGLADKGYVEGHNLTIAARYADGDAGRVPALAEELAKLPVDLITTQGTGKQRWNFLEY